MFYVLISAILFAINFYLPKLSLITIPTFLIPIYKNKKRNNFLDGFIWGSIVFGSYWIWILVLFEKLISFKIALLFWILIVTWCSLFSSLWIYSFKKIPIVSTILFFSCIKYGILILLGNFEGIPFLDPLLFFATYAYLLNILYYVPEFILLLILFIVQIYIAQQKTKYVYLYIICFFILNFILLHQKENNIKNILPVATITPWWYGQNKGAMFEGYRLAHELTKVSITHKPNIIVTPESTFCFDLEEYKNFIPIWCESSNNTPILLGTHILQKSYPHNATVFLHNNKISYVYLKKHAMPFMEKTIWIERIFQKTILSKEFIPQCENVSCQNDLLYISGKIYQIFLCSEFFFQTKKIWGYPILLLWNDTWLSCDYMKHLADLYLLSCQKKHNITIYHLATSGKNNIGYFK